MDDCQRQRQLIDNIMANPACLPEPAERIERLETHLSTVLLAGDHAYKIKKPLDLGFVDYSTLARRRYFCTEEVRLNQRLAPSLYLRTVPITGSIDRPVFDGEGEPIEYAVMMRRFPQQARLDSLLVANQLPVAAMDALGETLAALHDAAPRAPADSPHGRPERIGAPMLDNFEVLQALAPDDWRELVQNARDWTCRGLDKLAPVMELRAQQGYIRECHGDLHLGNTLQWQGEFVLFDAIEFDPGLRWIDLMSDLAFVLMDLEARGALQHAHRLKNAYLEASSDYQGLALLRLYLVYRAMVRAKIAILRAQQVEEGAERQAALAECRRYLELAVRHCREPTPALAITSGCSGSGKSTAALQLVNHLGYLRIRSDVERKRLLGLSPRQRADAEVGQGAYSSEMSDQTYRRLLQLSEIVLAAGERVVIDATFLRKARRQPFKALAASMELPLTIIHTTAAESVLRARVSARALAADDPSDATLAVLGQQLRQAEWPSSDEGRLLRVPTDQPDWEAQLLRELPLATVDSATQ